MKIIFDDQVFIEQKWGGISSLFVNYYKQINQYKNNKISLPFFFSFSKVLTHKIYIKKNKFFYHIVKFLNLVTVNFYLLFFDYDILHLTYFRKNLIHKKSKKFVISIPDMIPESNKNLFKDYRMVHPYKEDLAKKADLIITISKVSKKKILENYKLDKNKVVIIYPSIDKVKKVKNKHFSFKDYILFVGNRDGYKNFKIIFNIFYKFSKKFKNLNLICIGQDFSIEEKKIINRKKLNEQIINVGFVNDEYKNYLYQNAKLFVFPSLDEGFGIPIIESYANKCPVLLADTKIFREVAGEFGVFYKKNSTKDLYNKLLQILKNNNKIRNRFKSKKFIKFFKRYSHLNSKNDLEIAYSKLIND